MKKVHPDLLDFINETFFNLSTNLNDTIKSLQVQDRKGEIRDAPESIRIEAMAQIISMLIGGFVNAQLINSGVNEKYEMVDVIANMTKIILEEHSKLYSNLH